MRTSGQCFGRILPSTVVESPFHLPCHDVRKRQRASTEPCAKNSGPKAAATFTVTDLNTSNIPGRDPSKGYDKGSMIWDQNLEFSSGA